MKTLLIPLFLLNYLAFEVNCIETIKNNSTPSKSTQVKSQKDVEKRAAKKPFECPHDGYFPDPDACSKYYLCSGASVTQHDCGDGLVWDPELQLCGWANTIECKNGNRPWEKITDMNGITLFPTRPPKRGGKKKKTTTSPPRPTIETNFTCPWDAEGYYPDPEYCHIYHYCLPGVHTVLECSNGLWYSETDEQCMWPNEAVCAAAPTTTTTATEAIPNEFTLSPMFVTPETAIIYGTIECPNKKPSFYPDPFDCSAYHFCNGGKDKVLKCEPGLFYDKSRDVCDWRKNVNCKHVCPTSGERMKFVHPTSCCRYYECVNGELREFVCPYPKLFSTETKQCEAYQVVKCGIRENCKYPCDFDDSPLCAFTPKCSSKIDGYYIDEYRPGCKYYYLCKDERTYNYTTCDYGFRFNERLKRCDLASNVKCDATSLFNSSSYSNLISISIITIFSLILSEN